jgi:hypothetical protein
VRNYGIQSLWLSIFEYLVVFVMYLSIAIHTKNLTRKLLDVYLWDMIAKEKGGNVMILRHEGST